ncbi:MAG: 3-oxoacyl-[acyl-carrier-protein] synthase III C-terminal domain-containing protein [Endomicrobiales bacterium]
MNSKQGGQNQAYLSSVGCAVPEFSIDQHTAFTMLRSKYACTLKDSTLKLAERIFSHPSIATRHLAIDNIETFFDEDQDRKIKRFTTSAVRLASSAISEALARDGIGCEDVSALVINTCTGYICPGLTSYVIEKLGLRKDIPAYDLVGAGCAGAVPNVQLCRSLLSETGGRAVVGVSVEICSSVFQVSDSIDLIVSNALFADGAAAFVVSNVPRGFVLIDFSRVYAPEFRDDICMVYRGGQLHNQLSKRLPSIVADQAGVTVRQFLSNHGLTISSIDYWAMHAGGDNIIAAIENELGVSKDTFEYTRSILKEYGNMSSPSALFALERIYKDSKQGQTCLMLSFGAGFQMQMALFEKQ